MAKVDHKAGPKTSSFLVTLTRPPDATAMDAKKYVTDALQSWCQSERCDTMRDLDPLSVKVIGARSK